jgi:chaperonin GroES
MTTNATNNRSFIAMRNDRVLVERISDATTTKGGIILPGLARELPQLGTIISIGWKNPDNLLVGQLVLLPKFGGLAYDVGSKLYHLYHIKELIAVIYD